MSHVKSKTIAHAADWGGFWSRRSPLEMFVWRIYEKYRCGSYMQILKKVDLTGKSIIELGGGSGQLLGLLSKKKGAIALVVDNNEEAYEFYKNSGAKLGVKYLKVDMFKHSGKYDVVMSDGLIEHFKKNERQKVLSIHKRLMKKNGFAMIFVPKNSWHVRNLLAFKNGYEKKFSADELKDEVEKAGLKVINSISDMHMTGVLCKKGD